MSSLDVLALAVMLRHSPKRDAPRVRVPGGVTAVSLWHFCCTVVPFMDSVGSRSLHNRSQNKQNGDPGDTCTKGVVANHVGSLMDSVSLSGAAVLVVCGRTLRGLTCFESQTLSG